MDKTSKTIPHKKTASSSKFAAGAATAVEQPLADFVSMKCATTTDFKVENTSSTQDRCEAVSRYMCTITERLLEKVKKECNWVDNDVVVPSPEESITTYKEGYLSVYTSPSRQAP